MTNVVLSSEGRRDYKKLPRDVQILIAEIFNAEFTRNPFSKLLHIKKLKPPFPGYRVRLGDYRVLFTIESELIKIYRIRHRKDAYK
ncbi:MAG: type II toxin-antitoxin system RelE/ParE family toxin [bacterium]|nr:type II toxin-antitoxin system RelE/ParE family toxin [bacterium]